MKYLKLFENFNTDEIRYNIKDILLDIEDKGIYTNVYLDIWKKATMLNESTILISNIDLENISSSSMNPFTIDNDFFTTLEHLNSYLDSEDYRLSTISFREKDRYGLILNEGCDDLDELKRLIEVWNYDSFESIKLKYKSKKYRSKIVFETNSKRVSCV